MHRRVCCVALAATAEPSAPKIGGESADVVMLVMTVPEWKTLRATISRSVRISPPLG
jgi:hypothetical protein